MGLRKQNSCAFAPGHLTGIFVPSLDAWEPLARGSIGAGIVLDRGAHACVTVEKAERNQVTIMESGRKAKFPVTRLTMAKVLAKSPDHWNVRVEITHDLPVSRGFGMSAAGALSSAMALTRAIDVPIQHAIEAAHLAEIEGHGGLGGVPAILGGGIEVRRVAGIPPWGVVERTYSTGEVMAAYPGRPMPSPPLLSSREFLKRARETGERLMMGLPTPPLDLDTLLYVSYDFTRTLGLAESRIAKAMDVCRAHGARAAQAMLGHTIFVTHGTKEVSKALEVAGFQVLPMRIGRKGAGILRTETAHY